MRERGKTQTMEGTVLTEREVRNQTATINDTILIGTCSRHHQYYPDEDQQIKEDTFGIVRYQGTSIEKVYTWSLIIIQLKFHLMHTVQV